MGIHAKGTLLKMGDGAATEVFATVGELTAINGPNITVPTDETTSHDSPWGEHVGGIPDGGEVSLEGNYLPGNATHDASTGVLSKVAAGDAVNWELVFPDTDSTTWDFAAIIVAVNPSAPVNGKLGGSLTLTVTGEPTLA